ncbi:hypothetical protein AAFC00_002758 [Neodothiora populina]|uniref:Uncharacterized protein n=1 Tax=Neodothiora populina TaxID=2781224 RepID=A0ABR3P863_9PEZI
MVHKALFWGGMGVIVRIWQLGIEMRPFLARQAMWAYPVYAGVGASFGYWLQGVEDGQMRILARTKERLLEKRARRDAQITHPPTEYQKNKDGLFASARTHTEVSYDAPAHTEKTAAAS